MIRRIKDWITRRREARQRKARLWETWIDWPNFLKVPHGMFKRREYETWAKMQARILSRFRQQWQETHTYVRLETYYIPKHLMDMLKPDQFKKVATSSKDEHIFLIPDCQDQHVWEAVFETGTIVDRGKTIFMLTHNPPNWQEVVTSLFEIARTLSPRHPPREFENELSICRCLCCSIDADLLIAKVDLAENTVLSILEDTAREEHLELVVHRRSRKSP